MSYNPYFTEIVQCPHPNKVFYIEGDGYCTDCWEKELERIVVEEMPIADSEPNEVLESILADVVVVE